MEDDYKDISEIKAEARLSKQNVSISELNESILRLTKLINDLFAVFNTASEQMKSEEKAKGSIKEINEQVLSKMDSIIEQNKAIASGILSVADMIKKKGDESKLQPAPQKQQPPQSQQPPWASANNNFFNPPSFGQNLQKPPQMPLPSPPPFPTMDSGRQFQQNPAGQPFAPEPIGADMIGEVPAPNFDFPEFDEQMPFEEDKKKKGLFGRFKK